MSTQRSELMKMENYSMLHFSTTTVNQDLKLGGTFTDIVYYRSHNPSMDKLEQLECLHSEIPRPP